MRIIHISEVDEVGAQIVVHLWRDMRSGEGQFGPDDHRWRNAARVVLREAELSEQLVFESAIVRKLFPTGREVMFSYRQESDHD